MSGAETDTATINDGLRFAPRPERLSAEAALSRLSGRVTELEQENALLRPPAGAAPILLIDAQQLQSRVTELEEALRPMSERRCEYAWEGLHDPDDACEIQQHPPEKMCDPCRARQALAGSAGQEQA